MRRSLYTGDEQTMLKAMIARLADQRVPFVVDFPAEGGWEIKSHGVQDDSSLAAIFEEIGNHFQRQEEAHRHQCGYPDDCQRLSRIAKAHGVTLSPGQAHSLWRSHSEDLCATWLSLPESDDLVWSDLQKELEGRT